MHESNRGRGSRPCPADLTELAELYCLDRLLPDRAAEFEEHYLGCSRCADAVRDATQYVRDLRRALEQIEDRPRLARSAGS